MLLSLLIKSDWLIGKQGFGGRENAGKKRDGVCGAFKRYRNSKICWRTGKAKNHMVIHR